MEYRFDVVFPGGCMSQVQWSSRLGHVLAAAGTAIGLASKHR
jgi:SNF family Na+-dependent transporter